ncbi:hypothetical protein TNCV_1178631 [Trichonephila clavipes]|nr:hypothetical protein TNCV_1178631 [Trichonephila clavipes]
MGHEYYEYGRASMSKHVSEENGWTLAPDAWFDHMASDIIHVDDSSEASDNMVMSSENEASDNTTSDEVDMSCLVIGPRVTCLQIM